MGRTVLLITISLIVLLNSTGISASDWKPGTVEGEIHYGYATYYGGGYEGGCSMLDPIPKDILVTALNIFDFDTARMSGACLEVTGSRGTIQVLVTDLLPEGQKGDLDLNIDAFPLVADPIDGKVPISWRIVPLNVDGPVQYKYKEGSSQWWIGVQVRRHRYPVAKFEYLNQSGKFVEVPRRNYNYFESMDMGPGPYTFRVTDIYGHIIVDENIAFTGSETIVAGKSQFPFRNEDLTTKKPTPISTPVSRTPTPTTGTQKKITLTGIVKADMETSNASINEGFTVKLEGTQLSAVTGSSGSFKIPEIPEGTTGKIIINKPSYLSRTVELGVLHGDLNIDRPIVIWAGDVGLDGRQDGAINMQDVLVAAGSFNSSKNDTRYDKNVDFNLDGSVNMEDIMIMVKHFNKTSKDYT